jgi:hypothetical protein
VCNQGFTADASLGSAYTYTRMRSRIEAEPRGRLGSAYTYTRMRGRIEAVPRGRLGSAYIYTDARLESPVTSLADGCWREFLKRFPPSIHHVY